MKVCADINWYILVRKYHRNYVQSYYMRCQGVYPISIPQNICAETSGDNLLDNSLCYLDQRGLLFGDYLCFDISMYTKGKDMASVYPGSLHESRCPDRDLGVLERHLGHFHLSVASSLYLAFANTNKKETWCFGGICYRTLVTHLFTRLLSLHFWQLAVPVSRVFAVSSIVWKISLLLTNYTPFKNLECGGAYLNAKQQPFYFCGPC